MIGKATRPGFGTVTPYLIVRELQPMIDFLTEAFDATVHFQTIGGQGGTHTEMRIGDSMIMLAGGENGNTMEPKPTMIFLYLEDVDGTYQAALDAGATSMFEPTDDLFGEPRGAGIQDFSGNEWYFATWAERADAPPPVEKSDSVSTNTITTSIFTTELIDLLTETFETVQGMYLDKGTSLFETLATISATDASIPVGGNCATLAAQVEHTRYYLDVLEVYMRGERPEKVNWSEIWQTVGAVDEEEWAATQNRLRSSYNLVRTKITERKAWDNAEALSAAMSIVVHSAYHLGEIRQALCVLKG